ncbi:phosphoribosyl-ATP pyrophosphohydrolase [Paenibacillus sp. PK3_47]|uniref:nucleoside triphosphate pyrophosphohydrolase n=1 Tax=Paenibacillus sp. PK3_47 TaxID=2072642 RepID=UPI00201D7D89|nr:nucleoside triphosphate pyrophosphohydrolase [Paenibacillus sp. PK3_47]UQZ34967.1 phosphoribosyl-ATP pyrophosphohydrolase [Paenibacillus sp. PK3_47]
MPQYHKLVRDCIPDIIAPQGKKCTTKILEQEEYIEQLRAKLREETAEYLEAGNDKDAAEELADLLEVVSALAEIHGLDDRALETIRAQKAERRGGFKRRILLLQVEDETSCSKED